MGRLKEWLTGQNFIPDILMVCAILFNQSAHWLTRIIMNEQRDIVGDSVKAVALNKLTEANPVWALTVGIEGIGAMSSLIGILVLGGFYMGYIRRANGCLECKLVFVWMAFFVCFGDMAGNIAYLLGILA